MEIKLSNNNQENLEASHVNSIKQVLPWSHNLAASPTDKKNKDEYFRSPQYERLHETVSSGTTSILALTGVQGVGKTACLIQLHHDLGIYNSIPVNWGDLNEQIRAILNPNNGFFTIKDSRLLKLYYLALLLAELRRPRFVPIKVPKGQKLPDDVDSLDIEWTEKALGKARTRELREKTWFKYFSEFRVILIDLPDYARTDKRLLTRHLNQIYRLWTKLTELENPPTLVIAIQKDFIGGHFFIDKMDKIELHPLSTDQLLTSYTANFGSTYPFTETALRTLASRCRGNYRRFKRYVAIAVDTWPENPSISPIDDEHVEQFISAERVSEDLGLELEQLFPKNLESRHEAVRIILHLSDSGQMEQGMLAKALELPEYTMSRLLSRLELHRYITRQLRGSQKIVKLVEI